MRRYQGFLKSVPWESWLGFWEKERGTLITKVLAGSQRSDGSRQGGVDGRHLKRQIEESLASVGCGQRHGNWDDAFAWGLGLNFELGAPRFCFVLGPTNGAGSARWCHWQDQEHAEEELIGKGCLKLLDMIVKCQRASGDYVKQVTGNVNLEPQSKAEARDRSLERAWSLRGMWYNNRNLEILSQEASEAAAR